MIVLQHIGKALISPSLTIVHASGGVLVGHAQVADEKKDEVAQFYYVLPDEIKQVLHCPNDVDEFEIVRGTRRWYRCTNHVGVPMYEVRTADAGRVGLAPLLMLDRLYSTMTGEEAKDYAVIAVFNTEQMQHGKKMFFGAIRWAN